MWSFQGGGMYKLCGPTSQVTVVMWSFQRGDINDVVKKNTISTPNKSQTRHSVALFNALRNEPFYY